jgi:hypothetical protein
MPRATAAREAVPARAGREGPATAGTAWALPNGARRRQQGRREEDVPGGGARVWASRSPTRGATRDAVPVGGCALAGLRLLK